jgi:hypothetical protein
MFRQVRVSSEFVANRETANLTTILGEDLEPAQARELQGTIAFVFPDLEVEDVRIFDMPGVVDWLALIHARVPHLVYFLEASPISGALEGLALTLLRPEERETASREGGVSITDEVLTGLTRHLVACASFATAKGDDWEPIVSRFIEPLDQAVQERLHQNVREAVSNRR